MRSILFIALIWAFSATPALSQPPAVDCPTNWLPVEHTDRCELQTPSGLRHIHPLRGTKCARGEHEFDVQECQCEHGEQAPAIFPPGCSPCTKVGETAWCTID